MRGVLSQVRASFERIIINARETQQTIAENLARRKQRIAATVENRKARAHNSWREKRDWAHAYFEYIAGLTEKNRILLTVSGTLMSGGAAWATFLARERHQRQIEERLEEMNKQIESAGTGKRRGTRAALLGDATIREHEKSARMTYIGAAFVGCGLLYFMGFLHGRWHVTRRVKTVAEGGVAPTLVPAKGWGPFKMLRLNRGTDVPLTVPSSVDAGSVPQKKDKVLGAMNGKDVKTVEEILKQRDGVHARAQNTPPITNTGGST